MQHLSQPAAAKHGPGSFAEPLLAAVVVPPPTATPVAAQNIASQLRELAELKTAGAGALNEQEQEYTAAKERVLGTKAGV
jgi:hypothetical protein